VSTAPSDDDGAWLLEGHVYSPQAAAEASEMEASTLRRWANAGLIRHAIICRRYLLHAQDVALVLGLRLDHGVPVREIRLILVARTQRALLHAPPPADP
jgi:DNA-binding transcriptional MerR regulator